MTKNKAVLLFVLVLITFSISTRAQEQNENEKKNNKDPVKVVIDQKNKNGEAGTNSPLGAWSGEVSVSGSSDEQYEFEGKVGGEFTGGSSQQPEVHDTISGIAVGDNFPAIDPVTPNDIATNTDSFLSNKSQLSTGLDATTADYPAYVGETKGGQ